MTSLAKRHVNQFAQKLDSTNVDEVDYYDQMRKTISEGSLDKAPFRECVDGKLHCLFFDSIEIIKKILRNSIVHDSELDVTAEGAEDLMEFFRRNGYNTDVSAMSMVDIKKAINKALANLKGLKK